MPNAYIALGTNIEPRESHLHQAIHLLKEHQRIELIKQSSIYETKPVGLIDQADFLNMVVHVKTDLTPNDLLTACQGIEQHLGRKRTIRFGPRSIDLDILLFNNKSLDTEVLTIPHPRMHERAFVLIPLQEIAPYVEFKDNKISKWLENLSRTDLEGVSLYKS